MAVISREQQMLDLAEQGLKPAEIAIRMQIKRASVVRTLNVLTGGLGDDRGHRTMMAKGSARLATAIQTARAG